MQQAQRVRRGETETVRLACGGELTFSYDVDLETLSESDADFVAELLVAWRSVVA